MTEDEARTRLSRYLNQLIDGDTNYPAPYDWADRTPRVDRRSADVWVFWFAELPSPAGIVIANTHEAPFWGALGKLVPTLGPPQTPERFLASSPSGRYQIYADGIAVWEGRPDIGFQIPTLPDEVQSGREAQAVVVFFDLRGFTSWSRTPGRTAAEIQGIVRQLEERFQRAFSRDWCHTLFSKGTGDGFMLVSESGWFGGVAESVFQPGHASAIARACSTLIRDARADLPPDLAIGCGIDVGRVTQVFLLGRPDYIGSCVNDAAKIQQLAWDELCVSDGFRELLITDGLALPARRLGDRGWRINPHDCICATGATES